MTRDESSIVRPLFVHRISVQNVSYRTREPDAKKIFQIHSNRPFIENIKPLKNLRQLDSLSMWNLWLDREQINELKQNLPNLKIINHQWDIYETDSIGRVLPKLKVTLN